MGEQLYFLEVDKVLSNEEMEALSALSIDGFICGKTFTKDVEGYLDRVHPFKKKLQLLLLTNVIVQITNFYLATLFI